MSLRRRTALKKTKTNYLNYAGEICWEIRVSCLFICSPCCLLQTKEVRRALPLLRAGYVILPFAKEVFVLVFFFVIL